MIEDAHLYLLLTRRLCKQDPLKTLEEAIAGGVDLVQIREKSFQTNDTDLIEAGMSSWIDDVKTTCVSLGVPCLVNDDASLVSRVDGLHLGQEDLVAFKPGHFRKREFLVGISTHDPQEYERALLEDPDYIGVGPFAGTTTKGYEDGLDDVALSELIENAEEAKIPAFAIGGIGTASLARLRRLGIRRIAVSSAILTASDPEATARQLRTGLLAARP